MASKQPPVRRQQQRDKTRKKKRRVETYVCEASTEVQFCFQVFHLRIVPSDRRDKIRKDRGGAGDAREPVGTLASTAGAHERVDDRVALAQVVLVRRTSRPSVKRALGRQRRNRKNCATIFMKKPRKRDGEIVGRTSVAAYALQVGGDGTGALSETVVGLRGQRRCQFFWFGDIDDVMALMGGG